MLIRYCSFASALNVMRILISFLKGGEMVLQESSGVDTFLGAELEVEADIGHHDCNFEGTGDSACAVSEVCIFLSAKRYAKLRSVETPPTVMHPKLFHNTSSPTAYLLSKFRINRPMPFPKKPSLPTYLSYF